MPMPSAGSTNSLSAYLPLVGGDTADADADADVEAPSGGASSSCCGCCPPEGAPVDTQPVEWAEAVQRAWWYRVSSFSYCRT